MKRYIEYQPLQELWLDNIPTHWSAIRMKRLFDERVEKGYPNEPLLVASQNMGVVPKNVYGSRTVEAQKDLHLLKLVKVGDFVISLRSFQGGIEYAYYQGIISPAYTIMIPREPITGGYFRYLAKSRLFIELLQFCVTGIREGQNIDYSKLRNHFIPVPPRAEQDQIVRYLDWQVSKINRLIAAKKKQIELLKIRKCIVVSNTIMNGLYNQNLVQSGIFWMPYMPEKWRVTKLRYILVKMRRSTLPESKLLICSNSGQVIERGDIKLGLVASSNDIYQGVASGDLLIHGMDTWHGAIGISKTDGMCTPVVHVCQCKIEKRFVAYYLKMMAYNKVFKAISNGVRQNTSDFRSWDKVGDLLIAFPSIHEQVEVADFIDRGLQECDMIIDCYTKQINTFTALRARLISDVVTGQVDVRDIEVPEFEYVAEENGESDESDENTTDDTPEEE